MANIPSPVAEVRNVETFVPQYNPVMDDAPTLIGMHQVMKTEDSPKEIRAIEERLAQNPNMTLAQIQVEVNKLIKASTLNTLASYERKRATASNLMSYSEREYLDKLLSEDQDLDLEA